LSLGLPLRLLGTVWFAAMAGFFWSFSFVVMPGLDAAEPSAAMVAMQAINAAVRNPVFALGFFGAVVLAAAVIAHGLARHRTRAARIAAFGGALYLAGVLAVTALYNVPMNRSLAALDPAGPNAASAMASYVAGWTAWNHARTAAALTACVLLALSVAVSRPYLQRRA
jgi:uncharacterized membrane protein